MLKLRILSIFSNAIEISCVFLTTLLKVLMFVFLSIFSGVLSIFSSGLRLAGGQHPTPLLAFLVFTEESFLLTRYDLKRSFCASQSRVADARLVCLLLNTSRGDCSVCEHVAQEVFRFFQS